MQAASRLIARIGILHEPFERVRICMKWLGMRIHTYTSLNILWMALPQHMHLYGTSARPVRSQSHDLDGVSDIPASVSSGVCPLHNERVSGVSCGSVLVMGPKTVLRVSMTQHRKPVAKDVSFAGCCPPALTAAAVAGCAYQDVSGMNCLVR